MSATTAAGRIDVRPERPVGGLASAALGSCSVELRSGSDGSRLTIHVNSVDTALQFELALGVPAAFWNAREQQYREHLARRAQEEELARRVSWLSKFPVAEMVKRGLLRREATKPERVRELLAFLGVSSPERWSELFALQNVAFRKSTAFDVDEGSLAVWLRQGLIEGLSRERRHALDCAGQGADPAEPLHG
ncbi:hypothetical protein [Candidatus Palauibacter sp.]|uniref:hypothetical protein n=1 Tax=Candidatus Palauibacter sp. TaxID=3101350 RepID=UPI003B5249F5